MFGYIIRASACEDLLTDGQASRLLDSARRHGEFLEDSDIPDTFNNHDLLRDLGLLTLSEYFAFLSEAPGWRNRAWNRFKETLFEVVDEETGVHLEHSPGYHLNTVGHVGFLAFSDDPPQRIVDLLARMRDITGWFVIPDETIVQMGDTHLRDAPDYALESALGKQGLSPIRRVGYAIAKEGGSYFATAAGYHNGSHKHADELTFTSSSRVDG